MTQDVPTGDGPAPAEPPSTPSPQPETAAEPAAVPTAEPEPVAESEAVPTDAATPTPEGPFASPLPLYPGSDSVPPKRRLGLVLGLVGGGVALVLLLCAVLVPLALHSATTTRAGAATAASPTPSPSSTPLSDSEYQQTLDTIDNQLKVSVDGLRGARGPDTTTTLGTVLGDAIHEAAGTLDGITSPDRAELANRGLVSALAQLADEAYGLGTGLVETRICAGAAGLARLTQSDAAQSTREAVKELSSAGYRFGAFLPPSTPDQNRRLANGQFVKKASGGPGQLTIENKGEHDAMVTLAAAASGTATAVMYIQAGQTATARGIRNGSYNLFVSRGADWDADLRTFTLSCLTTQFNDPIAFTSSSGKYTVWTIQLSVGAGGNAGASAVDPGSIPT